MVEASARERLFGDVGASFRNRGVLQEPGAERSRPGRPGFIERPSAVDRPSAIDRPSTPGRSQAGVSCGGNAAANSPPPTLSPPMGQPGHHGWGRPPRSLSLRSTGAPFCEGSQAPFLPVTATHPVFIADPGRKGRRANSDVPCSPVSFTRGSASPGPVLSCASFLDRNSESHAASARNTAEVMSTEGCRTNRKGRKIRPFDHSFIRGPTNRAISPYPPKVFK